MKRIYFATSFKYRGEYIDIYKNLKIFLKGRYNIELYSFVFEYKGDVEDHEMMKACIVEMDKSNMIIAEVSYKSIGVGVEAGYFKAQGKKVIYLHKKGTEIENIINGISDHVIEYDNSDDILSWFNKNMSSITS